MIEALALFFLFLFVVIAPYYYGLVKGYVFLKDDNK